MSTTTVRYGFRACGNMVVKVSEKRKDKGRWELVGYYCKFTEELYESQPNVNWDTMETEEYDEETVFPNKKKQRAAPATKPKPGGQGRDRAHSSAGETETRASKRKNTGTETDSKANEGSNDVATAMDEDGPYTGTQTNQ